MYNTKLVAAKDAPKSWEDLIDPKWQGKIVLDASSYNWFVGMLDYMGEDKGLEFMKKLAKNGLQIQQRRSNVENMVSAGEVPVMVANSGTSTADRISQGEPLAFVKDPKPPIAYGEGLSIMRNAPHPHTAALFIETVLSEAWQRKAAEKIKIRAARPGVPDPLIDAAIKPHFVNPSKWPTKRYEWAEKEYVRILVRKGFLIRLWPTGAAHLNRSTTQNEFSAGAVDVNAGRRFARVLQPLFDGKTLALLFFSALLVYLVIVPLIVLVFGSFKSVAPGTADYFTLNLTLDNYVRAFASRYLPRATLNTAIFALGSSAIAFSLGAFLAWVTERTNSPFRSLLYVMAISRVILPGVLVTFAWIVLLSPEIGILNRLLVAAFGLKAAPFNIYSMAGMIWVEGIELTPLAFLLMASAFRSMDPSLEEAAMVAGSGPMQVLAPRHVADDAAGAALGAGAALHPRHRKFRNSRVDRLARAHFCLHHRDLAQFDPRSHRLRSCRRLCDGARGDFRAAHSGLPETHFA